ncbi:MAG: alpha/beta hydrolase [Planctomycetota bacterium]
MKEEAVKLLNGILTLIREEREFRIVILLVAVSFIGIFFLLKYLSTDGGTKWDNSSTLILAIALPCLLCAISGGLILSKKLIEGRQKFQSQDTDFKALQDKVTKQETLINNPPVQVINKGDYGELLREWNASGEGNILLYNIELQSFGENEIHDTWSGLSECENIKSVVLLLPEVKMRRWERIVLREEHGFFSGEKGQKLRKRFLACEQSQEKQDDPTIPDRIAFAVYRYGNDPSHGKLHDRAVVFVLSQPFSARRDPLVPEDEPWWDYDHILAFDTKRDPDVIDRCRTIWASLYDQTRVRDVVRVGIDTQPLEPVPPDKTYHELRFTKMEIEKYDRLLSKRELKTAYPNPIPINNSSGQIEIEYDNGDIIAGHYTGISARKRKRSPLIWVGGFTETNTTRLPDIFERVLKKEDVPQFFYQVSPIIEDITLTRYRQDMREVIRFVSDQEHVVKSEKIILIARSINGLLAPLVASEPEFIDKIGGVILIAPVFDVIEMIDNYRSARDQAHVRVEKFWRFSPGYEAVKWRDPTFEWLEFFCHQVSMALLIDIIRHDPDEFSFKNFKLAVSALSHKCPVHILSHPQDPITGSEYALNSLEDAAGGTGLIQTANYKHVPIISSHLPPDQITQDSYPFSEIKNIEKLDPKNALRHELRSTQLALREILEKLSLPVHDVK